MYRSQPLSTVNVKTNSPNRIRMNLVTETAIARNALNAFANGEQQQKIITKTRKELIDRYEAVLYDYLVVMNSSETLKTMDCQKYAIQLGLTAITHIYKLAFCFTKNVSTSADYCQKGIYCFIEYIEQTYKLGYVNAAGSPIPFDFMDAILFIYDKTISELRSSDGNDLDEHSGSSSAFTNILSVSQLHQAQGDDYLQCKSALDQFGRVASILLWFNNPTFSLIDQMDIVDTHLIDFLTYTVDNSNLSPSTDDIFLFIETAQETIAAFDKREYMDFLVAIKKQLKKQSKKGGQLFVLPACLYLKTFTGKSLKEIGEQEKWKKPPDDLAKLLF